MKYIILSDMHLTLLVLMGQLVKLHYDFEYRASSVSLIVTVHESMDEEFQKLLEQNRLEANQMKD